MSDICIPSGGNTGIGKCDLKALKIIGVMPVPKTAKIPKDGSLNTKFLKENFENDSPSLRWYPLMGFQQATDNSEEAQIGTLGYGYNEKLRSGNAIYLWDIPFTYCKAKTVIKFDAWAQGIYLISDTGLIVGRSSSDDKNVLPIIPESFNITQAQLFSLGTTDVRLISLSINMGDKLNLVEIADFVQVSDFDKDEMNGLIDLVLRNEGSSPSTGYADITVKTKCGDADMFDVYKTELSKPSVWKVTNKLNGAITSPTAVTVHESTKSFRLAISSTGTYIISLQSVSILEENGIEGYESNEIISTIN